MVNSSMRQNSSSFLSKDFQTQHMYRFKMVILGSNLKYKSTHVAAEMKHPSSIDVQDSVERRTVSVESLIFEENQHISSELY